MTDHQGERFSGMTLNERLFVTGLLDAFDAAARARDRARMVELLARVTLAEEAATRALQIIDDWHKRRHNRGECF